MVATTKQLVGKIIKKLFKKTFKTIPPEIGVVGLLLAAYLLYINQ